MYITRRHFSKSSKTYSKFIRQKLYALIEKNKKNKERRNPWPRYKFSGELQPVYPLSPKRSVPPHILKPDYADDPKGLPLGEIAYKWSNHIKVLTDQEIQHMKVVCELARECLDIGVQAVSPGITTDKIDAVLHDAVIARNCYPSPLNYYNFPKSCCTSVNEVVCHGIPDQRELQDGDIVNLDVTCYYNGFHGDVSETIFVGNIDEKSKSLVQTSYRCLMAAINEVRPGLHYSDLGKYIEEEASLNSYSVTRSYCGHGINQLFHTVPKVPHYKDNKAVGIMEPGHVFTIEPMINEGLCSSIVWPDNWTVVTIDGKRSAQFEHTVLVTETGVDILTQRDGNEKPYFIQQMETQEH